MRRKKKNNNVTHNKYRNNILSALLFFMLFSVMFLNVSTVYASPTNTEGYLSYVIEDGKATITACDSKASGEISIPNMIEGHPVTKIADEAFSGSIGGAGMITPNKITSIFIPQSITDIGEDAFSGCHSLTQITVDEKNPKYTSVGGVLYDKEKTVLIQCPRGFKNADYTIPEGVKIIEKYAFHFVRNLKSISIPEGVTTIEEYAFRYCSSLEEVFIPNSVTIVGGSAFDYCENLTSITIGANVESFCAGKFLTNEGDKYFEGGFMGCKNLESIIVSGENNYFSSVDGVLLNKEKTIVIRCPEGKTSDSYTIPKGVVEIGVSSFSNCEHLTTVNIPQSVKKIEYSAFDGCSQLTDISIPDSVIEIGSGAFGYCERLINIVIPNSITSIKNFTFSYCFNLTTIVIPSSVKSIEDFAFDGSNLWHIIYTGTETQWNAIQKNGITCTVHCNASQQAISYVVTKKPTNTQNGSGEIQCSICNEKKSLALKPLKSSFDKNTNMKDYESSYDNDTLDDTQNPVDSVENNVAPDIEKSETIGGKGRKGTIIISSIAAITVGVLVSAVIIKKKKNNNLK